MTRRDTHADRQTDKQTDRQRKTDTHSRTQDTLMNADIISDSEHWAFVGKDLTGVTSVKGVGY